MQFHISPFQNQGMFILLNEQDTLVQCQNKNHFKVPYKYRKHSSEIEHLIANRDVWVETLWRFLFIIEKNYEKSRMRYK